MPGDDLSQTHQQVEPLGVVEPPDADQERLLVPLRGQQRRQGAGRAPELGHQVAEEQLLRHRLRDVLVAQDRGVTIGLGMWA